MVPFPLIYQKIIIIIHKNPKSNRSFGEDPERHASWKLQVESKLIIWDRMDIMDTEIHYLSLFLSLSKWACRGGGYKYKGTCDRGGR